MLTDLIQSINSIDKQDLETALEKELYEFVMNMVQTTPLIKKYSDKLT